MMTGIDRPVTKAGRKPSYTSEVDYTGSALIRGGRLQPNMPPRTSDTLRFGAFTLDLRSSVLWRGEAPVSLRPKAFAVLQHLVENPGRVLAKHELIEAVWPNQAVSDDSLVQCMQDVRRALADDERRIVKTVVGRGYLFCLQPVRAVEPTKAALAQRISVCRSSDGVRLAVATCGEGMPLVRPPTWFNHLDYDWRVQFRGAFYQHLAEQVQLIRYDGRGSGLSDRAVPEMSFAALERDLDAVVDGLGLQRYALLGISQGGATAIAHAARHPDRVSRLILIGAYAMGRDRRGNLKDVETGQAQLTLMRHGWGNAHSAFLKSFGLLYFPSAPAEELDALAELQRASMSAQGALDLRQLCDGIDVSYALPYVRAPTLVVHSRHDNAVPLSEGRRLAQCIPNARFVVLESANHLPLPQDSAWPLFISEVQQFLGG